jgi:uncharacterized protein with PIN domain
MSLSIKDPESHSGESLLFKGNDFSQTDVGAA